MFHDCGKTFCVCHQTLINVMWKLHKMRKSYETKIQEWEWEQECKKYFTWVNDLGGVVIVHSGECGSIPWRK